MRSDPLSPFQFLLIFIVFRDCVRRDAEEQAQECRPVACSPGLFGDCACPHAAHRMRVVAGGTVLCECADEAPPGDDDDDGGG